MYLQSEVCLRDVSVIRKVDFNCMFIFIQTLPSGYVKDDSINVYCCFPIKFKANGLNN